MSKKSNTTNARKFYRRRQILKEELGMAKKNRKKQTIKGFSQLESINLQSMLAEKQIAENGADNFEFIAECDGMRVSFSINVPIDKNKPFPEDLLREVVTYGVCCKDSEFHLMETMLKSIDHSGVQTMIQNFVMYANDMRKEFESMECSKSQTIESLDQLHEKLKDLAPNSIYIARRNKRQNQTQPNQELNMENQTQQTVDEFSHLFAMDVMAEVNKEIEAQLRSRGASEEEIALFMSKMDQTIHAMNSVKATAAEAGEPVTQTVSIEEAATTNPQPETTIIKEETMTDNVNQTIDQAAAAVSNAAKAAADTASSAAASAADTTKETINKTKAVTTKAAEETKGFFARHQKKLYIGLGLIGLGGAAYFGWKKFGGSIVDAGEAAVEVVVDTAGQAVS